MIWLKLWPYALGAVLFGSIGAFSAHTLDGKRYAALELTFADYRTASTEAALKAQDAARAALEQQIEQAHKTTLANQAVMNDLQNTTAAIAADRDRSVELARRLLAATARHPASTGSVSETDHRSAAPPASETGSAIDVGELLVNASDECRRNAAQLNSLIAEIKPQL